MKHATRFLLATFLLLVFIGFPTEAQTRKPQDQKTKAEKDWVVELKSVLVQLQAVVTDRQGRLIDGLKKEDFELREKGRLQDISSFAEQRIGPLSISQPVNVVNVPNIDEPPPPLGTPARSLLLFVDTLHMSPQNVSRTKQSIKKFIDEQVTDQDQTMVVTSSGMEGIPARFTRDKNLLRHFVDRLAVWGSTSNSYFTTYLAASVRREDRDAIDLAIKLLASEERLDTTMLSQAILRQMVMGRAGEVLATASYKRISLLGSLRGAVELMSRVPGQRLLVFVSDGFSLLDNRGSVESYDLQLAISRAVRAGVVIYSISSKGLEPPPEIDASRRGPRIDPQTGRFDSGFLGRLSSYMSASEKEAQDGMNALANDTGGAAFFRTNDLNWALKKSFEGNHIYYALAYYPSTEGEGFRDITLRVKGHPEYTVRTQKGYLASDVQKKVKTSAKSPQQRLFEAMARPMPETAIGVNSWAHYLEVASDAAQVSIQVQMDGNRLTYREQLDRATIALEVAGSIYDRSGKLVTRFIEKINGSVPVDQLNDVKRSGFSYGKRIELKPGYYQVRMGVLDPFTENIGTASSWVEVPDLGKGKLALSSILLSSAGDAQKPAYDSQQLNTIKSYKVGSKLVYYLMLYNTASSTGADLTIHSELASNDKVVFESDPQPVSSRMMGKDNKGIEIGGQLNLDLEPGFYELRLAIRDKSNNEFRRSVDFLVER